MENLVAGILLNISLLVGIPLLSRRYPNFDWVTDKLWNGIVWYFAGALVIYLLFQWKTIVMIPLMGIGIFFASLFSLFSSPIAVLWMAVLYLSTCIDYKK